MSGKRLQRAVEALANQSELRALTVRRIDVQKAYKELTVARDAGRHAATRRAGCPERIGGEATGAILLQVAFLRDEGQPHLAALGTALAHAAKRDDVAAAQPRDRSVAALQQEGHHLHLVAQETAARAQTPEAHFLPTADVHRVDHRAAVFLTRGEVDCLSGADRRAQAHRRSSRADVARERHEPYAFLHLLGDE